jgi:hypothetical protein
MDKSTFMGLPVGVALGLLYDATPELARMQAPELARSPRYDGKVFRKGGFVWMSEMEAEGLRWWQGRKAESAAGNGQYADKDRKMVETLGKWIAWREQNPTAYWVGIRGDETVTAAPPSRSPALNSSEPRPAPPPPDDSARSDADDSDFAF